MSGIENRSFDQPDESRTPDKTRVDIVQVGGAEVGRFTFEPGWRWSEHVKPIAGTELCEAPHFQYHVAGTLQMRAEDGSEYTLTPGMVNSFPAGHDAWVVGSEPVVVVDWFGASHYAEQH